MKDFFKIFGVLCLVIFAFLAGQNHGEQKFRDSSEYQNLLKEKTASEFTKNDLENLRTKFQNIVDGAEKKKTEELLAQILQVFLADLGLRIQNQQSFVKTSPLVAPAPVATAPLAAVEKPKHEKAAVADIKKFHSYEWVLTNSRNRQEVMRNLKNVEIKDVTQFMKITQPAAPQQMESIYGSYRGRIFDINKNEYATLMIEIKPFVQNEKTLLKGSIKILKNGREESSKNFTTDQLGYAIDNSTGFIIDNGSEFFQIYKISETQQLAGHYYQRMQNGTTFTIGSFVLNRVDIGQP